MLKKGALEYFDLNIAIKLCLRAKLIHLFTQNNIDGCVSALYFFRVLF